MKITNIDVKGVICLLYYEIGHDSPPVLVSETPTNIYVDIEIPIDSLMAGELLITRELQVIFNQSDKKIIWKQTFSIQTVQDQRKKVHGSCNLPFFT